MTEELKQLRAVLTTSLDTIIDVCSRRGEDFPKLSDPVHQSEFTPSSIRNDTAIMDAISIGISAAAQIAATLQNPVVSLFTASMKHNLPACLSVAERANIPEILRESGPHGLHIDSIAEKCGIESPKLARVLRYLVTNYIFKEVSPDVFANNLISSCLDTGKSSELIKQNPVSAKFDNTTGVAAYSSVLTEDVFQASIHLPTYLTHHSDEHTSSPVQHAHKTNVSYWGILERPENLRRLRRFGISMTGTYRVQPPLAVIESFDWSSIPQGGIVVDVGSSLGHISMEVSTVRPDLKFVLEDREQVIEEAKLYWKEKAPEKIDSGSVHFIAHDFLQPQPPLPGTPNIFMLRFILHNWPDKYAIQILRNLRAKAGPETRLVVMEYLREAEGRDKDTIAPVAPVAETDTREGGVLTVGGVPPKPLLPNLGQANVLTYDFDITMMILFNASDRTVKALRALLASSGWELVEVRTHTVDKRCCPAVIAAPI